MTAAPAAAQELSVRLAVAEDGPALLALQARCPEGEDMVLDMVNQPDFFSRLRVYENPRVFVACLGDRIVGSAACALRDVRVGGAVRRIAYTFQIFVDPDARRLGVAMTLIRERERYLRESGAVLAYGLIFDGNNPSMRLFTKAGYQPARRVTLAALPVFRRMRRWSRAQVRASRPEDLPEIAALIESTWGDHELSEPVTAASLQRLAGVPGYRDATPFVLEDGGRIRACAAILARYEVTRVTVRSLAPKLRYVRTALDVARRFVPAPRIPGPGESLRQWMLAPVGAADPASLRELLRAINNLAFEQGVDQIFLGCEEGDPILRAFRGLPHMKLGGTLVLKPFDPSVTLRDARLYVDG